MYRNEREIGGMESAHDSYIWSLAWHPLGHILCSGSNDHTRFVHVGGWVGLPPEVTSCLAFSWGWKVLLYVCGMFSLYSKFWCRNRPGDEMKDKYNSFVNPLLLSEEAPAIGKRKNGIKSKAPKVLPR